MVIRYSFLSLDPNGENMLTSQPKVLLLLLGSAGSTILSELWQHGRFGHEEQR